MPPNFFDKIVISDTSCLIALTNIGSLDPGESSAIALALETKEPLLILDDAQARSFAQDIGLAITGTLGILIAAYRQGIIADLNPIIVRLEACNFRLPRDLPEILSVL
jgi:predicted nucleic acid-binding protein